MRIKMTMLNIKNQSIFWITLFSIVVQGLSTATTKEEPPKTCSSGYPKSCSEIQYESIGNSSELQNCLIYPNGPDGASLEVLCDFNIDGGGWTVFQRRFSGPQDQFNRGWSDYSNGFGSLDGDFWLGLENIRALTKNVDQELRIHMEDFEGNKRWAKYSNFSIADASDFYRLTIRQFSGDIEDNLSGHAGSSWSTPDQDNGESHLNCGEKYSSGWWFKVGCFNSNLNGLYHQKDETFVEGTGIHWYSFTDFSSSLAKTVMQVRTRKFI